MALYSLLFGTIRIMNSIQAINSQDVYQFPLLPAQPTRQAEGHDTMCLLGRYDRSILRPQRHTLDPRIYALRSVPRHVLHHGGPSR